MKRMHKILLVEDDPNLGMVLEESLELQGFAVERCTDGEEGHAAFLKGAFDLCLVDVMLPKKDGFALAKDIRKVDPDIPIVFLTAKALKGDRIEGFKTGGDDYVTKPFCMEELVLRMRAVLKRSRKSPMKEEEDGKRFSIGEYVFDYEQRLLRYRDDAQKLTHREAELLRLFCLHMNETLERAVALRLVWGDDTFFTARSMDVYVSKLRKYLRKDERIEIMNVHGKGFKMIVR
ncbi:MAG: response regulator transcription factor [bacterium]